MPSWSARIVNQCLPLLGIKKFFSDPEKIEERLAKMRKQKPQRAGAKWHKKLVILEREDRGYPVVTIHPRAPVKPGSPHLLYLHGGGYVMDVASVHFDAVCRLCLLIGASATVPIYPLAPEHKAPHILDAMRTLYGDLADKHGAQNITVMGDSAGGGMTAALAQMVKADGGPMPASLVLFSPWLNAEAGSPGQAEIEPNDKMLAMVGLTGAGQMYAGDLPLDDPRVSPINGEWAGLPPIAIFAGSSDILVVDARRLAAKLSAAGMPLHEYHEYKDLFHVWMLLPIPEGKLALEQTADFILDHHQAAQKAA